MPYRRDVAHRRLKVLRLVNKQFCKSASDSLFSTVDATLHDSQRYVEKPWPLARLRSLADSPSCAPLVKRITVGFSSFSHEHPKTHVYIQDLAVLLPVCLARFPNLIGLGVRGRTSSYYSPEDATGQITYARLFTYAVAAALRYSDLPYLGELSLALPVAAEFGQFAHDQDTPLRAPLGPLLGRLRHLALSVCDTSGRNAPVSLLKRRFPNAEHAGRLFTCIEMAPQLQTLRIAAPDGLDLSSFQWPVSLQLHALYLHGVTISAEALVSIVGPSVVQAELTGVELSSGTWRHVLDAIGPSSNLRRLRIRSCGYGPRWQAPAGEDHRPPTLTLYFRDRGRSPSASHSVWSEHSRGSSNNYSGTGRDQDWKEPWPWFGSNWL